MGSKMKRKVGLSILAEARQGEFDSCVGLLSKVLSNPIGSDDAKFRRLRTSNPKIQQMLAVKGVRALLIGAGWVEEGAEFLVLPEGVPVPDLQDGLDGLEAQQRDRQASQDAAKLEVSQQRKEAQDKENEQRKVMKMQIADDAAARDEPGWTAKAAGVKGGKAITSCSDIGAQGGGG